MLGECGAAPAREQAELIVQPARDVLGRKGLQACRRHLNGQRYAVQTRTNLDDCVGILVGKLEGWQRGGGPFNK